MSPPRKVSWDVWFGLKHIWRFLKAIIICLFFFLSHIRNILSSCFCLWIICSNVCILMIVHLTGSLRCCGEAHPNRLIPRRTFIAWRHRSRRDSHSIMPREYRSTRRSSRRSDLWQCPTRQRWSGTGKTSRAQSWNFEIGAMHNNQQSLCVRYEVDCDGHTEHPTGWCRCDCLRGHGKHV